MSVNPVPTLLGTYQLRLPVFEGPFDVLLRLIERDQLAVTDVSLVSVTDQFLEYIQHLHDASPELLAEFTSVAARLVALKTRSLLPVAPRVEPEPDSDELARQLALYQAISATAEHLRQRELSLCRSWPRGVQVPAELSVPQVTLASVPASSLLRAIQRCLRRTPSARETYRQTPLISLATMTKRILARLGRDGLAFSRLLDEPSSRSEVVAGFIALLALLRRRTVQVRQHGLFAEIEIERVGAAADD